MKPEPGKVFDIKGVPIYPGDLIRTYHFRDKRRTYYLYHVAVWNAEQAAMEMVPARNLALTPKEQNLQGGRCWALQSILDDGQSVVIAGTGPGECLDYLDRPRRKAAVTP